MRPSDSFAILLLPVQVSGLMSKIFHGVQIDRPANAPPVERPASCIGGPGTCICDWSKNWEGCADDRLSTFAVCIGVLKIGVRE